MSNGIVESLFLLAVFAPPLVVLAGLVLMIIGRHAPVRTPAPARVAPVLR